MAESPIIKRSLQSNNLYHEFATQLYRRQRLYVFNGEYELLGYPNPMVVSPRGFSYNDFRDVLKLIDLNYPKTENGLAISSAKLSKEQMMSHIMFCEVLIKEDL